MLRSKIEYLVKFRHYADDVCRTLTFGGSVDVGESVSIACTEFLGCSLGESKESRDWERNKNAKLVYYY